MQSPLPRRRSSSRGLQPSPWRTLLSGRLLGLLVTLPLADGGLAQLGTVPVPPSASTSDDWRPRLHAALGLGAEVQLLSRGSLAAPQGVLHYYVQGAAGVPLEETYLVASCAADAILFSRHRMLPRPTIDPNPTWPPAWAEWEAMQVLQETARSVLLAGPTSLVFSRIGGDWALAWRVLLQTESPWELLGLYIDAHGGQLLGQRQVGAQAVRGQIQATVAESCPAAATASQPLPHLRWQADLHTDADGQFAASRTLAQAEVALIGPYLRLEDESRGLGGPWRLPLRPSPASNDLRLTEVPPEHSTPWLHLHRARAWMLAHADNPSPLRSWAQGRLGVRVNLDAHCVADYAGDLLFYRAGAGCPNSATVVDVIYHEYGHALHHHARPHASLFELDAQVSEGVADYVAAVLTGRPNFTGLFGCETALRHAVNALTFCRQGCSVGPNTEAHAAGQVLSAALWSLRLQLQARYGARTGGEVADRLFLRFLALVGGLEDAYAAMRAADGPTATHGPGPMSHACEIDAAFLGQPVDATATTPAINHFPDVAAAGPCQRGLISEQAAAIGSRRLPQ